MTTPNPEIVASVLEALKQDRENVIVPNLITLFIAVLLFCSIGPIADYISKRYVNEYLSGYVFRKVADKDLCLAALRKDEKSSAIGYLFNISREDEYRELVNRGLGLNDCMKLLNLKPIDTSAAKSSSDDKEEVKTKE